MRRSSGAEFRNHGEERDAEILTRLQGTFGVRQLGAEEIDQDLILFTHVPTI